MSETDGNDGRRGLGSHAYEPIPEGETYEPFVPAYEAPAEFTLKAVLAGIVFGIVFGAANAYLGLRVGLTISTSIPVAVITVAAFKLLAKSGIQSSLLEANISQTVGSASSSVASGVIFTLPALFLWGLDPSLLQMTLLAMCGGLLGVLFMIPLRRFLIVREHGNLPYPEGTACAEVLVASQVGGGKARIVFGGIAVGALFKTLVGWARIFPDELTVRVPLLRKAELGLENSAALFGVGYILGPRIGAIMVGGGLLSWLVLIPLIAWAGDSAAAPLFPETARTIAEMAPGLIWTRYVRYIGAGAVAAGGLITLVRSIPTMVESFRVGARQLRARLGGDDGGGERTDSDLSLKTVGVGVAILVAVMALVPIVFSSLEGIGQRLLAAALVAVAAFFFVTVSSRIVGLVVVTSNPTSGMTIATLLATSAIFLALGWTGDMGKVAALTIGCVVAIAASIAGDTSQDLKTGFLVGGTPRRQQTGELIGVLTSAAFVCLAVLALHHTYGLGTAEIPAPQATLMKLVIEGVLESSLPWGLVGIGVAIAVVSELLGIPALPLAVGVYLPVSTMVPVYLGGAMRWWLERRAPSPEAGAEARERGVLFGSGLVGGEGILGVFVAAVAWITEKAPEGLGYAWAGELADWVALAAFLALAFIFWRTARGRAAA